MASCEHRSDDNTNYVDMIINLQNAQMELMQVMQSVKESVITIQNQMSILSSRSEKIEKLIIEQNGSNGGNIETEEKRKITELKNVAVTDVIEKFPKSEYVANLILEELNKYSLFKSCTKDELDEIVASFRYEEANDGEVVKARRVADSGLIFLEEGIFDLYEDADCSNLTQVVTAPGSLWDMLSIYGVPEAVIKARGKCKFWSFYYKDYGGILRPLRIRRQQKVIELLEKVHIYDHYLSAMVDPHDFDILASIVQEKYFEKDEIIVKRDDVMDKIYLIGEGIVDYFNENGESTELGVGDFFCERFLLNDNRTCEFTCTAMSRVKVFTLTLEDFITTVGNLQELTYIDIFHWRSVEDKDASYLTEINRYADEAFSYDQFQIVHEFELDGYFSEMKLVESKMKSFDDNEQKLFSLKHLDTDTYNEKHILNGLYSPFIIQHFGEISHESSTFCVMEALTGKTLRDLLIEKTAFSEEESRFYMASLVFALSVIHKKKIAHCNLKPENLAIDFSGNVKLINFSMAKIIPIGKAWTLCGTVEYLAPEILLFQGYDWSVDYWALGILIYELNKGLTPFHYKSYFSSVSRITVANYVCPVQFCDDLKDIISALLKVDQSKRLGRTKGGIKCIMNHSWFSSFDWEALYEKKIKATITPNTAVFNFLNKDLFDEKIKNKEDNIMFFSSSISHDKKIDLQASFEFQRSSKISVDERKGRRHSKVISFMHDSLSKTFFDPYSHDAIAEYENESVVSSISPLITSRYGKSIQRLKQDISKSIFGKSGILQLQQKIGSKLSSVMVNDSCSIFTDKSFDSFSLISVDPYSLLTNIKEWGNYDINPIVCKSASLLDTYPCQEMAENQEAMSLLCFPEGIKLRIIPRCAKEGAKRIGWLGAENDRYMLHVFHDSHANASFGISITTKEEIILPNLPLLLLTRRKIKTATKILHFWRKYRELRKRERKQNTIALFFGQMKYRSQNFQQDCINPTNGTDKTNSNSSLFSTFNNRLIGIQNTNEQGTLSQGISARSGFPSDYSEKSKRLGKESYQTMMENFRLGFMCIVEKCYLIVGTNPENSSLLFRGLKQLVDYERQNITLFGTDEKLSYRQQILSSMQYEISKVNFDKGKVTMLRYGRSNADKEKKIHELRLAPFLPPIKFHLPPPLISHEWGLIRLVHRIKLPNVILLMQLLLLERSVLVIGDNYEEVTACTCSLLDIIDPFKWVSTFIPLLPTEMLGFVCSPVPFIVGCVAENARGLRKIENDTDVKRESLNGLSVVNLVSGRVLITKEVIIERKMGFYIQQTIKSLNYRRRLICLQERVEQFYKDKESSLGSFTSFMESGLSHKESLTLNSILAIKKEYIFDLSGRLSKDADGWKEYGIYDESQGEILFSPEKKLHELVNQFKLQSIFTTTQLLAHYFEERKNSLFSNKVLEEEKGLFIADWLYFQWWKQKKRRNPSLRFESDS